MNATDLRARVASGAHPETYLADLIRLAGLVAGVIRPNTSEQGSDYSI